MAIGDIKTFDIVYAGLTLQVNAIDLGGGQTEFSVKCISGYADINALYWGDDVADGSIFDLGTKKDNSLNMNGTGVDWDGGVKVSSTGLGPEGVNKASYLTAGETLAPIISNVSWDDVDKLGVRATSTSTAEGSIKGVDGGAVVTLAPKACVDDAAPVVEGNNASFTIHLDHTYLYDVTINYTTVTGTAGISDYTSTTSSVTIAAGQLSAIVNVATTDDSDVEGPETFTLHLTGATADIPGPDITVAIQCADGTGTILDNDTETPDPDPPPVVNNFPDNGHDLSYATFYFGTTSGDTVGVYNGEPSGGSNTPDGVYTVKINFPGGNTGDLDDYYQTILNYIVAHDPNVDGDTPVLGVAIHAGEGSPALNEKFYAIDGDPDLDVVPNPPVDQAMNNEVDAILLYGSVFPPV